MRANTALPALLQSFNSAIDTLNNIASLALAQTITLPANAEALPFSNHRLTDNNDGTITDTSTGLMWSKATLTSHTVTHKQADETCAKLNLAGHSDWRLPTRSELLSLVDETKHEPAINTDAFPDTKNDWYWTSTISAWSSDFAWVVGFFSGFASYDRRDYNGAFVRAVRSLPAGE